jgi:phosphatidylglycerophosphate synthase
MDNDWRHLRETYPPEKKDWDCTYPWIAYILRPLSFPVSWFLHKAGATGNMVTVFTGVLGLMALPALAYGNKTVMMAGAFCILLYNFLDCVDGNLARAWPIGGPPVGKFWDQMVGNFYWLSYTALGMGLGEYCLLAMGSLITIEKYLIHATRHIYWNVLGSSCETIKGTSIASPVSHVGRWYYKVYYNLTDLQSHAFLLPLSVWFNWGDSFLTISFVFITGELVITLGLYLLRSVRVKGR